MRGPCLTVIGNELFVRCSRRRCFFHGGELGRQKPLRQHRKGGRAQSSALVGLVPEMNRSLA